MITKFTAAVVIALLGLACARPAFAYGNNLMTCAKASTLVANAPEIESNAILSKIVNEWLSLDARTLQAGHPAIEPRMVTGNNFFNQVGVQCDLNPGELLSAAAFQVYRSAREQIDGY